MIRRAIFWSFSSQIASFALQFGTSIAIARLLSPVEMGVYGVAWSVIGAVQIFTNFSIAFYVIREPDLRPETLDTAYTINTIVSVALASFIFGSSFVLGPLLGSPMVGSVLRLLSFTPIIGIVAFRPSAMLQRVMQLRGISILAVLSNVTNGAVTIGMAMLGQSSLSPAYGALVAGLVGSLGTLLIARQHHSFKMSLRDWRPMAAFGLRLMSIGGAANAASRICDVIVARSLGLAALGLYNRANNLSSLLYSNVYGSATRVVFAKLSEAQRDQDRVTEVYIHGFRLITAVMAPLLLGLAALGGPVIFLLYGEQWLGAAVPFSLLMVGQFVTLSFAMNWELFVIRDELKAQTRVEIGRSVVAVCTQLITSMISLVAVAASTVVDAIISFFMYRKHVVRLTRTSKSRLYRMYGETTLLGVVAATPATLLMISFNWDVHVPLPFIAIAVGIGIATWWTTILWLRHPLIQEAMLLLDKLGFKNDR